MRLLILLAASTTLAACSAGDRDDGDIKMKAGKWSQSMTVESFDLPEAPPEVAEMMQAMVGQTQTTEVCMTEDQVAKGWEEQAKSQMSSEECETESFSAQGGKLTGKVTCAAPDGGSAVMTIDGSYSDTSMDMLMSSDITDRNMGGGKMVMRLAGERVGDCDPELNQ